MRLINKEKTITHFSFDSKPNYQMMLGETVKVETYDCYGGQVYNETILRPQINLETMNQSTGPIYVNGLQKGDILCIDIVDIELDDYGVMITSEGLGILGDKVAKPTTKILQVQNNEIYLKEDFSFTINPMIGVIGVAPSSGSVHCAVPGNHGGNLDTKDITVGNRLYLPVFQDGGLLALGDLHASMGDGEMNGTGVEIGGKTTLTVNKLENKRIHSPIVENGYSFMFIASAETLNQAIKDCANHSVSHLQDQLSLPFEDAYRLLSAVCDLKISQIVNKLVTVRISVPKSIMPKLFNE